MDFFISSAMAADAPPAGGGLQLVFMVAIFFGIMYFMIIRPQAKKGKEHAALLESTPKIIKRAAKRGNFDIINLYLPGPLVQFK